MIEKESNQNSLTPRQREQQDFWNNFKEFILKKTQGLRFSSIDKHQCDIDFGFPKIHISCKMDIRRKDIKELRCEIDIPNAHKSNIYQRFLSYKHDIEDEFGERLMWIEDSQTIRRIRVFRYDFYIDKKGRWPEYFEWLSMKTQKFQEVFTKYK